MTITWNKRDNASQRDSTMPCEWYYKYLINASAKYKASLFYNINISGMLTLHLQYAIA